MAAPFSILKFYTKYLKRGAKVIEQDWVDICPIGGAQMRVTPAPVSSYRPKIREGADTENPAYLMTKLKWDHIGPAYEAWKKNQEITPEGTPLAAWPGITPEQATLFRNVGLTTVEDIAHATDSIIGRVQMPGARSVADNAKRFLQAQEPARVAAALEAKDQEMASLKEQLEEMKQLFLAAQNDEGDDLNPDGSQAPRRRGRPPKVQAEVTA